MQDILAVAEQRDGSLRAASLELLTAARELADRTGGQLHAALIGPPGIDPLADQLAEYGAQHVHIATHPAFDRYSPDGFAQALAAFIPAANLFAALFLASSQGKDLAPRVAARLDLPLASDATAIELDGGDLVITRPILAGRAFARVSIDAVPRLVSIRPGAFSARPATAPCQVHSLRVDGSPEQWPVTVRDLQAAGAGRLDVAEAGIIISGGRGMKGPENWHLLEELRDAIGADAALGASRAVVDAGWRPHSEQVGQTGKTVSPGLYFAVAISGAMQHLAGMRSSGTIVAINKDADAPIFKVADYGLVGDVTEILPRLSAEIRKLRST